MKYFHSTLWILFAVSVIMITSCDPSAPAHPAGCRISKFYWEDQWHKAYYNTAGRLELLEADSSKIVFYYDVSNRLVSAEVFTGDPTPTYKYKFDHGPFGIVRTNFYYTTMLGTERIQQLYHYAVSGKVDRMTHEEYGTDTIPTFVLTDHFTYAGGNLVFIDGLSSVIHTQYTASKYDKKKNPFRRLAQAVGNPAFFPVCRPANFPVADYDISFLSLFSQNNPLAARYQIVGSGLDPQRQRFDNTYAGPIARKILWDDVSYGVTSSEDYAFEFDCGASDLEIME